MENKQQRPIFLGFSSQKGGVGKSTLAEIVSSILYYEQDINLFVVDCDLSQDSKPSRQHKVRLTLSAMRSTSWLCSTFPVMQEQRS